MICPVIIYLLSNSIFMSLKPMNLHLWPSLHLPFVNDNTHWCILLAVFLQDCATKYQGGKKILLCCYLSCTVLRQLILCKLTIFCHFECPSLESIDCSLWFICVSYLCAALCLTQHMTFLIVLHTSPFCVCVWQFIDLA